MTIQKKSMTPMQADSDYFEKPRIIPNGQP